jgi:excisionase family DNA binding protein
MKTWLTVAKAAEYAQISEWTIREAVKSGDLEAYAVGVGGRSYRVTAEDVDKWMMSRSFEPKTAS